jgi:hypothetical protein
MRLAARKAEFISFQPLKHPKTSHTPVVIRAEREKGQEEKERGRRKGRREGGERERERGRS